MSIWSFQSLQLSCPRDLRFYLRSCLSRDVCPNSTPNTTLLLEPSIAAGVYSAIKLLTVTGFLRRGHLQSLPNDEHQRNVKLPVHDRALLLHGCKRNDVLSLSEIEQYGLESFANADYVSIYGMPPREWYGCGIRLLGRTGVECTRDPLGDRIGRDVASVARRMPSEHLVVIDPFAGSCNTLFWILRHLPNSEGMAFESDPQVFDLTHRNLAILGQRIELLKGDYARLLQRCRVPEHRGVVAFIAPPWGTALDEAQGLDLRRTSPPVGEVIDQVACQFPRHNILFAMQIYEKVSTPSLTEVQARLDWTELHIYDINEKGQNHGIVLGSKGWTPSDRGGNL
jgi:hypothetical protein